MNGAFAVATTRLGDSFFGRPGNGQRWRYRSTTRGPCPTRWSAGASSIAAGRRARMHGARILVSHRAVPFMGLAARQ